ncbi:cytochrome C (plasmid) [Labrenzia sp. CP4]|jgi:mono/diheme cytochrome c family protein|uniref:c-type cytochrome n=1 Tax=Labrenzia sp. CP4 TaxID=1674922 RepID=UPI00078467C3|nr:cytochrome c [Labrenzia sp. CP4]AMN56387.1 cytochrome C [Labrenzia sp. CP4]
MRRKLFFVSAIVVSVLSAIGAFAQQEEAKEKEQTVTFLGQHVTSEKIALGQRVYGEYCASCHGASLEGQPDWKRRLENGRMPAPPHDETGHTWHHSDQDLFDITKLGVGGVVAGYESDMPAFGDSLSDNEITAALAFIKSTWPERQRDVQARISAKDGGAS